MRIGWLVWSEIVHRKLNFFISLLAVTVAVALSVGVVTFIRAHDVRTRQRVAALDDDIRKITKNMGFNITILPQDQNLADFHSNDFGQQTMPYDYVQQLANSQNVFTIQHLRPALIRKMQWPEKSRQILLMGVSGVVPFAHRNPKKPLSQPVPKGTMNIGSVLAEELQISEGDTVSLMEREFRVAKVYPQRGSKDDITVWIDLDEAQEMLDMRGRISMIQALECNCASVDRLAEIQTEISALLGDEVQVIELASKAIARAQARVQVQKEGEATVRRLETLASIVLPLMILGASVLVGLLSLTNVRDRRTEIGILRAVGTRSRQILALFVSKAALVGILGAAAGFAGGFYGARLIDSAKTVDEIVIPRTEVFQPEVLTMVMVFAPILAILASWLPAMTAAAQDPAVVLREE